jgi:hypothetical protein
MIYSYPFRRAVTSLRGPNKEYCSGTLILHAPQAVPAVIIGVSGSYSHKKFFEKRPITTLSWHILAGWLRLLPYQATNDNSGLLTQVRWERRKGSWEVVYSQE